MWQAKITELKKGRLQHFSLVAADQPLSFSQVIELWHHDQDFREFFIGILNASPLEAYRWETPAMTATTIDREFEFILLRSDALARRVDPHAFSQYFSNQQSVVTFANLGRDAILVVPCPAADINIYGHLGSFLRGGPYEQVHQLWVDVAVAIKSRIGDRPVWLSTAGMGVSWLHIRLDDRPKYYGYAPYRNPG